MYLWLDGVYLKAGLEKEKAALLVAIGVKKDGHKVVLAVSSGYRESTASWSGVVSRFISPSFLGMRRVEFPHSTTRSALPRTTGGPVRSLWGDTTSSRYAAPTLRCGPADDAMPPHSEEVAMAVSGLPAMLTSQASRISRQRS